MLILRLCASQIALALGGASAGHRTPADLLTERRWGVNIHSTSWSAGSAELLRSAFTAIRQDFQWDLVERQRGVYDWSAYEALLEQLGPRVVPYIILDYGNSLYGTSPSAANNWTVIERNNTEAIRAFVRYAVAAMRRFRGRGIMWELWNEPNGKWCCGHLEPEVYGALALAIADERARLSPELDGEVLAGPTTCGCDLAYMGAVFETGALSALDAVSWHPYRGGGPETVAGDNEAVRALARRHRPSGAASPPLISGEWGWATCFTARGDPAPCVGGATGGSTVSRSQQAAFLARQWLTNALDEIPLSIYYDWSDGDHCIVTEGGSSDDCYGVFERPGPPPGLPSGVEEAHGRPKPAFHAAVTMQSVLGTRQVVKRLQTAAPPPGRTVEAGSDRLEGSKCLSLNVQAPSMASPRQDAAAVFAVAFGVDTGSAPPVAKAAPGAPIEAFALWSVSDLETSTTIVESTLASACFNRTSLYGVWDSHSYCFNMTGHLHLGLLTQPELYTRTGPPQESPTYS